MTDGFWMAQHNTVFTRRRVGEAFVSELVEPSSEALTFPGRLGGPGET